jgi:16S rRNA (guanine527-N7)-methyltransferase
VNAPENNSEPTMETLREMLAAEGIHLTPSQIESLDRYRQLLWSWNERMNLTRHTTLKKFVGRDVVDSYQLAQLLKRGERVLDVGTGGGVPGVILALLRPDLVISLCESTQKKARAVEEMVNELELSVPVYAARAEEVLEISTFDTLVARALAALPKVLTFLVPHWDAFDQLLLIKGPAWVQEQNDAHQQRLLRGLSLSAAANYYSTQIGAQSTIVKVRRRRAAE